MRARVAPSGGRPVVSSNGDRGGDYEVTFESRDGGRGLDPAHHIYADQYTRPFVVRSFYERRSTAVKGV